jgi:L-seryl-tRNA(Ser) seleniumtransferase
LEATLTEDSSYAGGGSLPGHEFPTYAVSIKPKRQTLNELEQRMRGSTPPVISRIKGDMLLLDARTISDSEARALITMSKTWCVA